MQDNQLKVACCWAFSLQLFFADQKWCMTLMAVLMMHDRRKNKPFLVDHQYC